MPSQRNSIGSSSGPSRRRREPSSESEESAAGDEAAIPGSQGDGGGRGGLSGSVGHIFYPKHTADCPANQTMRIAASQAGPVSRVPAQGHQTRFDLSKR
jgi:hypothetical protein